MLVTKREANSIATEPALRCNNIERYLGEEEERVHALRGISLTLEPGTVHAVVDGRIQRVTIPTATEK